MELITSPGMKLSLDIRFSQAGITPTTFAFILFFAKAYIVPTTAAAPAISPLIPAIELAGFKQYPPVSQATPFPTKAVTSLLSLSPKYLAIISLGGFPLLFPTV